MIDFASYGLMQVLINSAAVCPEKYKQTVDGFEMQLQTNHLGPFLFTSLIYPRIVAGGSQETPARIVNISSRAHVGGPFRFDDINFSDGKTYDKWPAYRSSKTANIQFTNEIVKRTQAKNVPILAYSVHPGCESFSAQFHVVSRSHPNERSDNESVVETALASEMDLKEWIDLGFKNEKGEWITSVLKTVPEGSSTYVGA